MSRVDSVKSSLLVKSCLAICVSLRYKRIAILTKSLCYVPTDESLLSRDLPLLDLKSIIGKTMNIVDGTLVAIGSPHELGVDFWFSSDCSSQFSIPLEC